MRYLADYVGDSIVKQSFKMFYSNHANKFTSSKEFESIIRKNSSKNLDWFFGDYISTNKRIDYTIKKAVIENDSVVVTIKNKRNTTAPVALYGVKNKEVKFKKWLTDIEETTLDGDKKGSKTSKVAEAHYKQLSRQSINKIVH